MPPRPGLVLAGAATVVLVTARLLPLPPLRDAVTGLPALQCSLRKPASYVLTAPFSGTADLVTFNSARQDKALAVYLLLGYWAYYFLGRGRRRFILFQARNERRAQRLRALLGYPIYLCWVAAFLAWALLWHRPTASLVLEDPDELAVDFHSHSSISWDGRRALGGFTPEANMAWHRRNGFGASFLTDHNTVAGAREAKAASRKRWKTEGFRALEGEELSLQGTHIVALGNTAPIDNELYNRDLAGVFRFLKEDPRYGGLSVMSLPEYWRNHPVERWEKFALGGAAGFEIVNAAPKALDFPSSLRARVVEICRKRRLFAVGATDNHGWGQAAYVWNVMRIPGQARLDPDRLQQAVLAKLRRDGLDAARVVVRAKQEPLPMPWLAFDPLLGLWTLLRTFSWGETVVSAAWIWLAALVAPIFDL